MRAPRQAEAFRQPGLVVDDDDFVADAVRAIDAKPQLESADGEFERTLGLDYREWHARKIEIHEPGDGTALPFPFEADGVRTDAVGCGGREGRVDGIRRQRLPRRRVEFRERGLRAKAVTTCPAAPGARPMPRRRLSKPGCGSSSGVGTEAQLAEGAKSALSLQLEKPGATLDTRRRERRQGRFRHRLELARVEAQALARRRGGTQLQRAAIGRQERRAVHVRVVFALWPRQHERLSVPTPVRDHFAGLGHARFGCRAGHRKLALNLDWQQGIDGHRAGQAVAVSPDTQRLSNWTPGSS